MERLLRFCWRKDYWGCWRKISAIMILMTLKIRISVNFGEKVSAIRIFRVWRCNLSVESILKSKNKSIEDTFCNWKVSSILRISRLRIQLHLIWKPNCIYKLRKSKMKIHWHRKLYLQKGQEPEWRYIVQQKGICKLGYSDH